jgi:glycosyltransferase involved in cell wall biosynthesis
VKVPGAVRLGQVYQQSKNHFSQTSVLTTSNRRLYQQDTSLETDAELLYEVPAYDLRRFLLRFRTNNTVQVSTQTKKHYLYPTLSRLLDSFPLNILIGDGGLVYILKGYRKGKELVRKQGVTHLFSSFRPYSDHVIAYLLKRTFPQLCWVADFRDLHVDPANRNVLFPRFQKKLNQKLFCRANLLTTVSKGLEQHLAYYGPPTHVMYNGIGEQVAPHMPTKSNHFTITYTGSLFKNKRRPDQLLKAVKLMIDEGYRIKVAYAGKDGKSWNAHLEQHELKTIGIDCGMLPLDQARQLQGQAQLNLLLTYSSPELTGNLTGKLYEYFAARKPVIAIINGPVDSEIEALFDQVNAGLVVYHSSKESIQQIKIFIKRLYQQWETGGDVNYVISEEALEQFQWPQLFKAFVNRLNQISKN